MQINKHTPSLNISWPTKSFWQSISQFPLSNSGKVGTTFQGSIRLLHTDVASSVKVSGWLTAFSPLQRCLWQGCALSMPLYVLTAEMLAAHIHVHPNIKGLQHPASQLIISKYADDTTLLLADDNSLTHVLKIFEASAAKINLQKCKGLWCGSYRHRTDTPTDFVLTQYRAQNTQSENHHYKLQTSWPEPQRQSTGHQGPSNIYLPYVIWLPMFLFHPEQYKKLKV